jgi:hypothetical protein
MQKDWTEEQYLLLAEAESSDTPASRLAVIFSQHGGKRRIIQAVMRNPNTPPEILIAQMKSYADVFCQNQAAPLLLLENPSLLKRHINTLKKLLRSSHLPTVFAQILATHSYSTVQEAALLHVVVAGELEGRWEKELREIVASKIPAKSGTIRRLHAFGVVPDWLSNELHLPDKETLAHLKQEILPRLKADWNYWKQANEKPIVSDFPLTDTEKDLIDNRIWHNILINFPHICRPSFSHYVVEKYYDSNIQFDRDDLHLYSIFCGIAGSNSTPGDVLKHLMTQWVYRNFMLQNPNLPTDILHEIVNEGLEKDQNFYSLSFLFNPKLSSAQIITYAKQRKYPEILLTRSDIPEEVCRQSLCDAALENANSGIRLVAILSTTQSSILRSQARSLEWLLRLAVSLNTHTEKKYLKHLAEDGNRYVRAVAKARLNDDPLTL